VQVPALHAHFITVTPFAQWCGSAKAGLARARCTASALGSFFLSSVRPSALSTCCTSFYHGLSFKFIPYS
jgi:hypothetical protein